MAEFHAAVAVDTYQTTQRGASGGVVFEQADINNEEGGIQRFVFKTINSASTIKIGSPVGETQAAPGNTVTATQATAGAAGWLGDGGGICQAAVVASTVTYGFIQSKGIGRTVLQTTGALAVNSLGDWTGDDTVAASTTSLTVAIRNLVVAASGSVPVRGWRKYQ